MRPDDEFPLFQHFLAPGAVFRQWVAATVERMQRGKAGFLLPGLNAVFAPVKGMAVQAHNRSPGCLIETLALTHPAS